MTTLLPFCIVLLLAPSMDWLVTRDGDRIETDGPWKIEGKRVVFQLPNGNLSSVRLSEIDLEASAIAAPTEPSNQPKNGSASKASATLNRELERSSRWTLVESDVARAKKPATVAESEAPVASAQPSGLHVSEWRDVTSSTDPGARLRGNVAEGSFEALGPVTLRVTLVANDGLVLDDVEAVVAPEKRGWPRTFEALFPGVFEYDRVSFEATRPEDASRPSAESDAESNRGTDTDSVATPPSEFSSLFHSSPFLVVPFELGKPGFLPGAVALSSEMPS